MPTFEVFSADCPLCHGTIVHIGKLTEQEADALIQA